MARASGAVREVRWAVRAESRSLRTAFLSYAIYSCLPISPGAASDDPGGVQRVDLALAQADLHENFLGVLTEQRRARDLGGAVRELDGIAYRQVLAALGMIDFDDGSSGAQRRLRRQLLHGQDRPARDVVLVELGHGLELVLGHGPLLDGVEHLLQARQPRIRRGVIRVRDPLFLADDLADLGPHWR